MRICEDCGRYRPEEMMVRLNLCVSCHTELEEQERREAETIEAFRCKHCGLSRPPGLMDERPEPGTHECWQCLTFAMPAPSWEDREQETDHADSKEHSDWWDTERRLWAT